MRDTTVLFGAVLTVAITIAVLAVGAPVVSGDGLTWDSSATIARQQSRERVRLAELAQADADSARWHDTVRWLTAGGGVVGVVALLAWTWRKRQESADAVRLAALPLLAQRPGARLEIVDGDWAVVDDARQEIITVPRRLSSNDA